MEWRSGGEAGSRHLECAGTSCVPWSRQTVNFLSSMGKGGVGGGGVREENSESHCWETRKSANCARVLSGCGKLSNQVIRACKLVHVNTEKRFGILF